MGVGLNGWSYHNNMGEPAYRISQTRCCLVLVGRVRGLLFDGRHFCTEVSFAGHLGLHCGDFLVVSILVCV